VLFVGFITANRIMEPFSNFWVKISLPTLILIVGYFTVVTIRLWGEQKVREKVPDTLRGEQRVNHSTMSLNAHIRSTVVGSTIGGYEVSEEIEQDSMGVIFRGHDSKTGTHVAIKTVKFSEFEDDHMAEIRARFFRETECLPQLKHQNVIMV
jgi:hypothetical protein